MGCALSPQFITDGSGRQLSTPVCELVRRPPKIRLSMFCPGFRPALTWALLVDPIMRLRAHAHSMLAVIADDGCQARLVARITEFAQFRWFGTVTP